MSLIFESNEKLNTGNSFDGYDMSHQYIYILNRHFEGPSGPP